MANTSVSKYEISVDSVECDCGDEECDCEDGECDCEDGECDCEDEEFDWEDEEFDCEDEEIDCEDEEIDCEDEDCAEECDCEAGECERAKKRKILNEKALVEASIIGNYEKLAELLSSGVSADAEAYNNKISCFGYKNYMTPLQLAADNGHIKCVQILLDNGANVNAQDRFGVTALHLAAEKGNYFCLKALLDAGADCLPTEFSKPCVYGEIPYLVGTTPLHLASANNHVDCVAELIQYGADYNAVDEYGRTSLYIAAETGLSKCVLAHLKDYIGREILSLPGYKTNDTPLHFAVFHGMIDCVRGLLKLGSDVNHLNIFGYSPLHFALTFSESNHAAVTMDIVKMLILEGYNTDINLRDCGYYTPLHYVCFYGQDGRVRRRPEMAKFFISYGADVNIRNCRKTSLLHIELLSAEQEYDVLKYIVRSMLHLPSLKELNLDLQRNNNRRIVVDRENRPPNPNFQKNIIAHYRPIYRDGIAVYEVNMREDMPFWSLDHLGRRSPPPNVPQDAANDAQINGQLQVSSLYDYGVNMEASVLRIKPKKGDKNRMNFRASEKIIWYNQLASQPRTLQHCCRFAVRQTLGSCRLKHIRKLPIPPGLQSYILLEHGE